MWLEWYRLQPFYSLEAEMRIKQWLATGTVAVDVFLDEAVA